MNELPLLDDPRYHAFVAETHPALSLDVGRWPLPCFVSPLDVREPLLPGLLRAALHVGQRVAPAQLTPRSLFLGTPFERYDQTRLLDCVDDVAALVADAKSLARSQRLDLVVFTCLRPDHPRLPAYLDAGFVALPSFPDTLIPLAPRCPPEGWQARAGGDHAFEAYLATLPAADRSGIRRNVRRFERAGHRIERVHDSRALADDLMTAYRHMWERARVKWFAHTEAYFAGLAGLDPRVRLHVARAPGGDVIGFIVNFGDGDSDHAGRIGVRPDYHRRDGVYFRLLYHVLDESLRGGRRRLVLEPTGYRMKRHLGARRRRMINLVLGVSPTWRLLLSSLAGVGRRALSHLDNRRLLEEHY